MLTGDPNPEVTWFINGVPLTESEKIKFINEDGICIVIIKDVTRHFDGIVTCQVFNYFYIFNDYFLVKFYTKSLFFREKIA